MDIHHPRGALRSLKRTSSHHTPLAHQLFTSAVTPPEPFPASARPGLGPSDLPQPCALVCLSQHRSHCSLQAEKSPKGLWHPRRGFEPCLSLSSCVSWSKHLASLSLGFLFCRMGILSPACYAGWGTNQDKARHVPAHRMHRDHQLERGTSWRPGGLAPQVGSASVQQGAKEEY